MWVALPNPPAPPGLVAKNLGGTTTATTTTTPTCHRRCGYRKSHTQVVKMVSNAPPIIVFFPQYDIAIADGCYTMLQLLRLRVPNARTPFRLRPGKVHSLSHSLTRLSAGWLFVYDFSMTDSLLVGFYHCRHYVRSACA